MRAIGSATKRKPLIVEQHDSDIRPVPCAVPGGHRIDQAFLPPGRADSALDSVKREPWVGDGVLPSSLNRPQSPPRFRSRTTRAGQVASRDAPDNKKPAVQAAGAHKAPAATRIAVGAISLSAVQGNSIPVKRSNGRQSGVNTNGATSFVGAAKAETRDRRCRLKQALLEARISFFLAPAAAFERSGIERGTEWTSSRH